MRVCVDLFVIIDLFEVAVVRLILSALKRRNSFIQAEFLASSNALRLLETDYTHVPRTFPAIVKLHMDTNSSSISRSPTSNHQLSVNSGGMGSTNVNINIHHYTLCILHHSQLMHFSSKVWGVVHLFIYTCACVC